LTTVIASSPTPVRDGLHRKHLAFIEVERKHRVQHRTGPGATIPSTTWSFRVQTNEDRGRGDPGGTVTAVEEASATTVVESCRAEEVIPAAQSAGGARKAWENRRLRLWYQIKERDFRVSVDLSLYPRSLRSTLYFSVLLVVPLIMHIEARW
jgi:hypothetical protein